MQVQHAGGPPVRPGWGIPASWSSEANVHSGSCHVLICPSSLARCQWGPSSHRLWAGARGAQGPQVRTQGSRGGSAHSYVRNADVHPARGGAPRRTLPSVHRSHSCRPGQGPPGGRGVIVNPWSSRKVGCPARRPTRPAYLPPLGSKFTLCRRKARPVSSASQTPLPQGPGLPRAEQEARRTPERAAPPQDACAPIRATDSLTDAAGGWC